MTLPDVITAVLALLALIPLTHYIYRYHRYSPWRRHAEGRVLMYQKLAMWSLFVLIFAGRVWGDWPGRQIVTFILFAILVIMIWRFDFLLVENQKGTNYDRFKLWWERTHRVDLDK